MEFMYSIPDLEVFIDKTIKKCLLEYDLDANDTEAVLDDMEKAWPKSPPTSPENSGIQEHNDNVEKARKGGDSAASQIPETTFINTASCELVLANNSSQSASVRKSHDDLSPSRRLAQSPSVGGDCNRSDTSSPDVRDSKLHPHKHSKLKSILQQRYFEGNKSPGDTCQTQFPVNEGANNITAPSNLHLLASAANLRTGIGLEYGQQETTGSGCLKAQVGTPKMAAGSLVKLSCGQHKSARGLPVLTRLMSSPLSSPLSSSSRAETFSPMSRPYHLNGLPYRKSLSTSATSALTALSSEQTRLASQGRVLDYQSHILSTDEESVRSKPIGITEVRSSLDQADLATLGSVRSSLDQADLATRGSERSSLDQADLATRGSERSSVNKPGFTTGVNGEDQIVRRSTQRDVNSLPCVNGEKARRLYEQYQKGYHAVIPRDLVVVRKELVPNSSYRDSDLLADKKTSRQLSSGPSRATMEVRKIQKQPISQYATEMFTDVNNIKQSPPIRETEDLQVHKKISLSSSSRNKDIDLSDTRKRLQPHSNDGNKIEVRKKQNLTQAVQTSSSVDTHSHPSVSPINYINLPIHATDLVYTSHQPRSTKLDPIVHNPQPLQRSCIASIIVEELEKDNADEPDAQTEDIIHRFIPQPSPPSVCQRHVTSTKPKPDNLSSYRAPACSPPVSRGYRVVQCQDSQIPDLTPQILLAHAAKPCLPGSSNLLTFHQGHVTDVHDPGVMPYVIDRHKVDVTNDDSNQPQDLSLKSSRRCEADARPVVSDHNKPSPNHGLGEDHSHGYFSSPTSPAIAPLGSCGTESTQVLQKSSPSSPLAILCKTECDYSSEGEVATDCVKLLGTWEKKGQVHGLDILPKRDSKAVVEKRRVETMRKLSDLVGAGGTRRNKKARTHESQSMPQH